MIFQWLFAILYIVIGAMVLNHMNANLYIQYTGASLENCNWIQNHEASAGQARSQWMLSMLANREDHLMEITGHLLALAMGPNREDWEHRGPLQTNNSPEEEPSRQQIPVSRKCQQQEREDSSTPKSTNTEATPENSNKTEEQNILPQCLDVR